jgi:uncharacterized membrane protein YfcA
VLLAAAIAIVFLAAFVRGYSGFGFSLLAITALSLLYTPATIILSIFLLEIAASIHLLPGLWRDVHWRSLIPLVPVRVLGHLPAMDWVRPENNAGKYSQH